MKWGVGTALEVGTYHKKEGMRHHTNGWYHPRRGGRGGIPHDGGGVTRNRGGASPIGCLSYLVRPQRSLARASHVLRALCTHCFVLAIAKACTKRCNAQ